MLGLLLHSDSPNQHHSFCNEIRNQNVELLAVSIYYAVEL